MNLYEQSYEWQDTLIVSFIDFDKAFDLLHRLSLWDTMRAYDIPEKFISQGTVQFLYQDSGCVGHTSEWFKVETGVKQGCMMSGFLFLLVIDWIMHL